MEERYSLRYFSDDSQDTEIEIPHKPTPEQVLEIAEAWCVLRLPTTAGMHWVIYDRARGLIVAEDDAEEGGWVNPQWLIATGLTEQEGL